MEQFEIRTHKRLLDIIGPTAKTVDELKKLNLPAGADVSIRGFEREVLCKGSNWQKNRNGPCFQRTGGTECRSDGAGVRSLRGAAATLMGQTDTTASAAWFRRRGGAPARAARRRDFPEKQPAVQAPLPRIRFGCGRMQAGDVVNGNFRQTTTMDVTGMTKGKGFQGVMRRHDMSGGVAAHGGHSKRRIGSIGSNCRGGFTRVSACPATWAICGLPSRI